MRQSRPARTLWMFASATTPEHVVCFGRCVSYETCPLIEIPSVYSQYDVPLLFCNSDVCSWTRLLLNERASRRRVVFPIRDYCESSVTGTSCGYADLAESTIQHGIHVWDIYVVVRNSNVSIRACLLLTERASKRQTSTARCIFVVWNSNGCWCARLVISKWL